MRGRTLFLVYIEARIQMENAALDRKNAWGILVDDDCLALIYQRRHRQAYKIAGRLLEKLSNGDQR